MAIKFPAKEKTAREKTKIMNTSVVRRDNRCQGNARPILALIIALRGVYTLYTCRYKILAHKYVVNMMEYELQVS